MVDIFPCLLKMQNLGLLGLGIVLSSGEVQSYVTEVKDFSLNTVRSTLLAEWKKAEISLGERIDVSSRLNDYPFAYFCRYGVFMDKKATGLFVCADMSVFLNIEPGAVSPDSFETDLFYQQLDSVLESETALLKKPEFARTIGEMLHGRKKDKKIKEIFPGRSGVFPGKSKRVFDG